MFATTLPEIVHDEGKKRVDNSIHLDVAVAKRQREGCLNAPETSDWQMQGLTGGEAGMDEDSDGKRKQVFLQNSLTPGIGDDVLGVTKRLRTSAAAECNEGREIGMGGASQGNVVNPRVCVLELMDMEC